MGFINEELTAAQQKEFNSWGITYPLYGGGQLLREIELKDPCNWTIDKERNIYLLGLYSLRDHYEERIFVFLWNKKRYIVQFRESFENGNNVIWNIPEHYISKDIVFPYCEEIGFIDDLRDALIAFGDDGHPEENVKRRTKCSF
ncbi:MAG: hypothetical protein IJ170_03975 [Ruminococcus sp.]|nr:hypothetical protein [Ruminococcus sp.]